MDILSLTTYMMSNISDINEEPMWETPFVDEKVEYILIEKKELSEIYDVYLYTAAEWGIYAAWLASKDIEGNPVGWQLISYDLAKKIFPELKSHKFEYMGPTCEGV